MVECDGYARRRWGTYYGVANINKFYGYSGTNINKFYGDSGTNINKFYGDMGEMTTFGLRTECMLSYGSKLLFESVTSIPAWEE